MAESLTTRQSDVLAWITRFIATNSYPPTRSEIAKGMDFKSVNAAEEHVQALERKGAIRVAKGVARGIVIEKQPGRIV